MVDEELDHRFFIGTAAGAIGMVVGGVTGLPGAIPLCLALGFLSALLIETIDSMKETSPAYAE
jgi:hypothetical protein